MAGKFDFYDSKDRKEVDETRNEVISAYSTGRMSLDDIHELIRIENENSRNIGLIRVDNLMSKKTGWTKRAIRSMLMENGINPDVTVKKALRRKDIRRILDVLESSTITVFNAPPRIKGFPWNGSVIALLDELGPENVGNELLNLKESILGPPEEPWDQETTGETDYSDSGYALDSLFGSDDDEDANSNDDYADDGIDIDDLINNITNG